MDLWSDSTDTPAARSRFVGLTYRGGICLDKSYTVLEERGSFENIKVSLCLLLVSLNKS